MKNPTRKEYLLAAIVTGTFIIVAIAVTATVTQGEFSVCGEFCQKLGCNHNTESSDLSKPQDDRAIQKAEAAVSTQDPGPLPSCQLSETQLGERMSIIRELCEGVLSTRELSDGYEMTFPGSAAWGQKLFDFISAERQCCPFFLFELKFEPREGSIHLALRGGPEVKEFLENFQIN